MAMLNTAHDPVVETAVAQAASVSHFSFVNNPKYYLLLNSIGVGTVAGTIAIKFWIYAVRACFLFDKQVSNRLAKKYDSNVLYANALHHRADALSSIAALAGLCGRVSAPSLSSPVVYWGSLAGSCGRSDCGLHHLEGGLGYLPRCHARSAGRSFKGEAWSVVESGWPHAPEDYYRGEQRQEWRLHDWGDSGSSIRILHVGSASG